MSVYTVALAGEFDRGPVLREPQACAGACVMQCEGAAFSDSGKVGAMPASNASMLASVFFPGQAAGELPKSSLQHR
ncbi:MAG TPA: hypothetical protein PLB25_13650 [Rhodoferax sp.]|nr:hypothetical protein [Rhodoferax sp.]